jgi:membrane protease YdiL (CAAX protease family)
MNEQPPQPVNPYLVTSGEAVAIDAPDVADSPRRKPRVWTVFVAIIVALVLTIVASIVGAVGLVLAYLMNGGTPNELQADVNAWPADPVVFMVLGGCAQLAMIATALAAGWLSPQALAYRLGFVQPKWPLGMTLLTIVGSIVPFALGIGLAHAILPWVPADQNVEQLYKNMTPALALPWVLFIAVAPGISEETLFRGYVQRRLIERWPAWVGILITSLCFAIFHIQPHAVLFAFPLGVWLGMMAWKSGSVWPGVLCHAAVNGLWNIYQVGSHFGVFPEDPPSAAIIVPGVLGLVAFGWSLRVMLARK